MPHHTELKIKGRITDVFGHRFVIERADGTRLLADIGPRGIEKFAPKPGIEIEAEGQMRPTELKVGRLAQDGAPHIRIDHHKKHGPHADDASPAVAIKAGETAGFAPIGKPRRKPKHFEMLARRGDALMELHVDLDGRIRKERPVDPQDEKWMREIKHAA